MPGNVIDGTEQQAVELAAANGLTLAWNPGEFWQLASAGGNWLINLAQPTARRGGRIWHEPGRVGPKLEIPRRWTLLDCVVAAIGAEKPGRVPPLERTDAGGSIRRPGRSFEKI